MNQISKKKLNKIIDMTKEYWETGDIGLLNKRMNLSEKLGKEIEVDWLAVLDFLDGILKCYGLCPDAEYDKIYCALRCIGWEAVDDGEEHPAN